MHTASPFTLRVATNSDADAIWALISGVLREYGIIADRLTTDRDLADIEGNYSRVGGAFMVLVEEDRLVGTVALCRDSESCCELCRMYLAAPYRGRGLGRLLLDAGLREASERGFTEVRLESASVLKEAISLYCSAGFTIVEDTPVGKNCNVVMVKHLTTHSS